jgi:hypothetical protein
MDQIKIKSTKKSLMQDPEIQKFADRIFWIRSPDDFNGIALELFSYQYRNNDIYRQFCTGIGRSPDSVKKIQQIPFLPVELFKSHRIVSVKGKEKLVFRSSGTGGGQRSVNYVFDTELYTESVLRGFESFYGQPSGYLFIALCPSPEERSDSSLAFMADLLICRSKNTRSGFFPEREHEIRSLVTGDQGRIFLFGLSFALADLAEKGQDLPEGTIVMETGGMKGRRREITRSVLHEVLKKGLGIQQVHSEYSMCELFSQAYSSGDGLFFCPPWMKVFARNDSDPFELMEPGRPGGLNIIDLANIYTCCFIETGDRGRVNTNGSFEVFGRLDPSNARGCAHLIDD